MEDRAQVRCRRGRFRLEGVACNSASRLARRGGGRRTVSGNVEGRAMRHQSMLLPGHKSAEPPVLRIRPIPPEPDCETVEVAPVPDHSQRDEAHRKCRMPLAMMISKIVEIAFVRATSESRRQ
jgi:hypothetical protein